jgi:hypothetical protein
MLKKKGLQAETCNPLILLVRLAGIEPTTPWFVAKYSIQLSYSREERKYSTTSIVIGSPCCSRFIAATAPFTRVEAVPAPQPGDLC